MCSIYKKTRYSVQPRNRIFVKVYGFLPFTRNMGKNIGKNISKILISKYSQKILDHTKQSGKKEQFKKRKKQLVI